MAFMSELTGKPVVDIDGKQIGVLQDLIAREFKELRHPIIEAIVIKKKTESITVFFSDVAMFISQIIPLKCHLEDTHTYLPQEHDIYLVRDVLDKQIIDTNGARVVRVNDVELVRVNGNVFVGNVDISGIGILRRIGMKRIAHGITARLGSKALKNYISWDFVEPLLHDQFMRLKVPKEALAKLHPADIAEIISDLNHIESGQLLESLNIEQLADALEEVEPDFQASLVKSMSDERVADVLEEMAPDEAADLLAELPKERSEDLLELMEDEDADDVRRLLTYPVDSAGGLMTTEYAAVLPGLTAEQAIISLRDSASEAETIFYIYVVDTENHLLGALSLSDLLFAQPSTPVSNFMHARVVSVQLEDEQEKIAQVVAKYNLLAVPVVDEQNCLHGMVTADDALDKIIPTAWKKRLPRFYY